jgi:hypothetical protein
MYNRGIRINKGTDGRYLHVFPDKGKFLSLLIS